MAGSEPIAVDNHAVPAVRLRGVRKQFGPVVAVDGVDLTVHDREFLTLLGPSGSGKTTVLRLIAGFELPSAGTIELAGVDVTQRPPFDRDVNTVFQDYALFPHLTVAQNVEYGLVVRRSASRSGDARVGRGAGAHAAGRFRRAQAEPALRRPAPAGRPGPGADQPAQGAAAGRAARRARPQAARADAGRAQGVAAAGGDHVRLRHPRPGRGADHVGPDRGVQRRPHRAGGHAGRGVRAAGDGVRRRLRGHLEPAAR